MYTDVIFAFQFMLDEARDDRELHLITNVIIFIIVLLLLYVNPVFKYQFPVHFWFEGKTECLRNPFIALGSGPGLSWRIQNHERKCAGPISV